MEENARTKVAVADVYGDRLSEIDLALAEVVEDLGAAKATASAVRDLVSRLSERAGRLRAARRAIEQDMEQAREDGIL